MTSPPDAAKPHLPGERRTGISTSFATPPANANQVDVSRLQYLLLLGRYLILLMRYLGSLDGTQILLASHDHVPVFPSMPPVDGTFLGLLVLSHGGYLAFKALPSARAGGLTG